MKNTKNTNKYNEDHKGNNEIYTRKQEKEVTYGLTECKRKLGRAWIQLQGIKNMKNEVKNTKNTNKYNEDHKGNNKIYTRKQEKEVTYM